MTKQGQKTAYFFRANTAREYPLTKTAPANRAITGA